MWNGTPVAALPHEVKPTATYNGITLFSEFPEAEEQAILFVPISPGCEFQPYYYFTGGPPGDNTGTEAGTAGMYQP